MTRSQLEPRLAPCNDRVVRAVGITRISTLNQDVRSLADQQALPRKWVEDHRRVVKGEKVPNEEKLFSMFEPHRQLYKRGKSGEPVQFGRLLLIHEDGAGFITHHHVLPRDMADADVVVEQTRMVQDRLQQRIEEASFDCGFHSPENQTQLAEIIPHVCLPKPGAKQSAEQQASAGIRFHKARQRHAGVESAIGALQSGNGLKRCRDHILVFWRCPERLWHP